MGAYTRRLWLKSIRPYLSNLSHSMAEERRETLKGLYQALRRWARACWVWLAGDRGLRGPTLYVRLAALGFVVGGLAYIVPQPHSSLETRRWTMSALAQSAAALLGLILVVAGFLRQKAGQAQDRLRAYHEKYRGLLETGRPGGTRGGTQVPEIEVVRKRLENAWRAEPDLHPEEFYLDVVLLSCSVMSDVGWGYELGNLSKELTKHGLVASEIEGRVVLSSRLRVLHRDVDFLELFERVVFQGGLLLQAGDRGKKLITMLRRELARDQDDLRNALASVRQGGELDSAGFSWTVGACVIAFLAALSSCMLSVGDKDATCPATVLLCVSFVAIFVSLWTLVRFAERAFLR